MATSSIITPTLRALSVLSVSVVSQSATYSTTRPPLAAAAYAASTAAT